MSDQTRLIIRAAMAEYLILIGGALALYGAVQIWPRSTGRIAFIGGSVIALLCISSFLVILRSPLPTRRGSRR